MADQARAGGTSTGAGRSPVVTKLEEEMLRLFGIVVLIVIGLGLLMLFGILDFIF